MGITIEARREFVRECTAVSVWLARRLASQGMGLREALTTRTNVYRLTTLYDGQHHAASATWRDERWEGLMEQLEAIDRRYPRGDATKEMEAEAVGLLWPVMEGRVAADVAEWPRPEQKPFGFFQYRAGDRGWEEGRVTLHLSNPFAPASPFEDLRERARELGRLLVDARGQKGDLRTVFCASWLSSLEVFQSLFPASFAAGVSEPLELAYHLGWWGQLMDRRGGYHWRNGEHLRRTGEFPHPCVACTCGVDEALGHLRERFGV